MKLDEEKQLQSSIACGKLHVPFDTDGCINSTAPCKSHMLTSRQKVLKAAQWNPPGYQT